MCDRGLSAPVIGASPTLGILAGMSFIGDLGSAILGTAYALRVPLAVAAAAGIVLLIVLARRRGWARVARRHPVPAATAAVLLAAALATVPAGWYLVSPIFTGTELQEAPIVAAADPSPSPDLVSSPPPSTLPPSTPSATSSPGLPSPGGPPSTTSPDPSPTPWQPAPARTGTFEGTDEFHFGRGTAILSETAPGEWVVRFEGFAVRNGPDLYVYLSPDPDGYADGAVEVARLRADRGSFNTRVPPGTDVSGARSVLIWCRQFSHLFAVATLRG